MWEGGYFNGCALVAVRDVVLLNEGFGWASFEWGVFHSFDGKFDIGSIAKQFTTVMVLQLAEAGRLKLDDPILRYLPGYRADVGSKVTVEHLLRHTSGIPCFLRDYRRKPEDDLLFPFPEGTPFESGELIRLHMSGDLLFEPGTSYRYSNTGFYLLGKIIESVTGQSYEKNLAERICLPLGLKNTGLLDNFKVIPQRVDGYIDTPAGMIRSKRVFHPNIYGADGIYSTTGDVLVWNRALHAGPFLSPTIREKIFTPYWKEGGFVQYGYSLNHFAMRLSGMPQPVRYTSFNGATSGGFISDAICFEEEGLTVILLDNGDHGSLDRMAGDVYRLWKGQKVDPPKPQLGRHIAALALEKGVETAAEEYDNILAQASPPFEGLAIADEIRWAALTLADAGRNGQAETLLRLNRVLHPHAAGVHETWADFLEHRRSPEASPARAAAAEVRRKTEKLYGLVSRAESEEASFIIAAARAEHPRADVFEANRIGPLFAAFFEQGRLAEAIRVCRLWAEGNPGDAGPYFSLARIYEKQEARDELKKCYARILEIAKNPAQIKRAQDRLKELK
jgi:CubicO group peptidase (beta-lactamase class C family)